MKQFEKIIMEEDPEVLRGMLLQLCQENENNQSRLIAIYYKR